ncbi:MAG: nucleoside 2-deoxyribosyltransferase [Bryobacterales bacterium]|nr:nucleoside 2-deoxyribosyltransferase [Bryobacterales bacterium]
MKIYFAGSIRGGREDQVLYASIVELLRAHGEVSTEHVAGSDLTEKGEDGPDDRFIHARDMVWLGGADAVVAEVSTPSLGVGYEIGRAVEAGKPVLCLFREGLGRVLSAMIAGCPQLEVLRYRDCGELAEPLGAFLRKRSPTPAALAEQDAQSRGKQPEGG